MQNVLAEHEMFEKFSGGEMSKQGQAVETISCQANDVGQFRQAFMTYFFQLESINLMIFSKITFPSDQSVENHRKSVTDSGYTYVLQ